MFIYRALPIKRKRILEVNFILRKGKSLSLILKSSWCPLRLLAMIVSLSWTKSLLELHLGEVSFFHMLEDLFY